MRAWIAVGIIWTSTLSWTQSMNLAKEPKSQQNITVWLKLEPMREALRAISKQVGILIDQLTPAQHQRFGMPFTVLRATTASPNPSASSARHYSGYEYEVDVPGFRRAYYHGRTIRTVSIRRERYEPLRLPE